MSFLILKFMSLRDNKNAITPGAGYPLLPPKKNPRGPVLILGPALALVVERGRFWGTRFWLWRGSGDALAD
jgi:hypothetical protein